MIPMQLSYHIQCKKIDRVFWMQHIFSSIVHVLLFFGFEGNIAVLGFIFFDEAADQHDNLTVRGTALVICNEVQLVQHLAVNADRNTFYGHFASSKDILWLYFMFVLMYNV